jgi:catalase (peroxidase I)
LLPRFEVEQAAKYAGYDVTVPFAPYGEIGYGRPEDIAE